SDAGSGRHTVADRAASSDVCSADLDGTFTITPSANYNGTVSLSYDVTDGDLSVAASQSFVLAAVNDAPTGSATASLAAGTEDTRSEERRVGKEGRSREGDSPTQSMA